jgi:hypothetical protein
VELEALVEQYRTHYDLWIDSADDVNDLRLRLRAKGYRDLPLITGPMIWLSSLPGNVIMEDEGQYRFGNYPVELCPFMLKKLQRSCCQRTAL